MTTAQIPAQTAFPFLDLKARFSSIREDVIAAVTRVLDSQQFILGPEVSAFEDQAGQYLGSKFSEGCASGSDALLLGLMALEVVSGDEVVTTPFTFVPPQAQLPSWARYQCSWILIRLLTTSIQIKWNVPLPLKPRRLCLSTCSGCRRTVINGIVVYYSKKKSEDYSPV